MRSFTALLGVLSVTSLAMGQAASTRFIEVQVTDTMQLPFAGLDYEVRMPNPFDLAGASMPDGEFNEKTRDRVLDEAAAQARASEERFLSILKVGEFTHRVSSTEHAEDYMYGSERTYDVNTYMVELKNAEEMERFFGAIEGVDEFYGNVAQQRFGSPASVAPKLMRKLYEQARSEAEALVAVAGGRLGQLISAQELARDEGSFLEQLFRMEKQYGGEDEAAQMLGSVHTSTMAFRFELLSQ